MRKAKLHELTLPTRYKLWRSYLYGTELQNRIGPEAFADLLTQSQAIELVNQKGTILCKTLNKTLIEKTIEDLNSKPWEYFAPLSFYKVARVFKRLVKHQKQGPNA